jgi:hypothetical protein
MHTSSDKLMTMLSPSNLITIAALAGATIAQSTVTLFIPGGGEGQLVGSVVGQAGSRTVYSLACPSEITQDSCGLPDNFVATFGPDTLDYEITIDAAAGEWISGGCTLHGSTSAVCVEIYSGDGTELRATSTFGPSAMAFVPVIITDVGKDATVSAATATPSAAVSDLTAISTVEETKLVSSVTAIATVGESNLVASPAITSSSQTAAVNITNSANSSHAASNTTTSATTTSSAGGAFHHAPQWTLGVGVLIFGGLFLL